MKTKVLAVLLTTGLTMTALPVQAELTFGEKQTIRVLAGQSIGSALNAIGVRSLGVISNRSAICSSLVGGIGSGLVAANRGAGFTYESINSDADISAAVMRGAKEPAVYLAFGGEWDKDRNVDTLNKVLNELKDMNYQGKIIFHATTWAQKQAVTIVNRDAAVAKYLAKADVYAITLDLKNSQAAANRVTLKGKEFSLTELGRVNLRADLVELFTRPAK
jgi:hypothetical protein